jgi:uncharacterized protein
MNLDISRMIEDLRGCRAFRRIEQVSFLGVVDVINQQRPGNRPAFNRAQHSLGVLRLGMIAAHHIHMQMTEAGYLLAACMVHDLGHAPFSHSLEYAFPKTERSVTHHDVLMDILLSPVGGERSVPRIIERNGLSCERVFRIIDGKDPLSFFFYSPINIDTIDGINRSMQSFAIFSSYNVHNLTLLTAELYAGRLIGESSALLEMDKFWDSKKLFYHVLSSENPLSLAERRFQRAVRRHLPRLERGHFNMTDREFALRYPQVVREFNNDMGPEEVAARQDFLINLAVRNVDKKTVYDRYIRVKHENREYRAHAS